MNGKIGWSIGLIFVLLFISTTFSPRSPAFDTSQGTQVDLIPGDLLFMDYVPTAIVINNVSKHIRSNDHVALYIGQRQGYPGMWCVSAGLTYTDKGVDYVDLQTYLDTEKVNNLSIGRVVTATDAQRNAAILWVMQHIGDSYQNWGVFPPRGGPQKCSNPTNLLFPFTRDKWYCAELVWAAYYNQGIDIDNNKWGLLPWVLPSINMGVPTLAARPFWLTDRLIVPYAYYNEIQIDDDVQLLDWT